MIRPRGGMAGSGYESVSYFVTSGLRFFIRMIGAVADHAAGRDCALARLSVETIAPHRRGRVRPKTPDSRPLPRYRRWKIERDFA